MNAHSLFAALNHPPLDINFSQVPLFPFLFKLIVHYTTIRSRVYPLLETFLWSFDAHFSAKWKHTFNKEAKHYS